MSIHAEQRQCNNCKGSNNEKEQLVLYVCMYLFMYICMYVCMSMHTRIFVNHAEAIRREQLE